MMVAIHQPNFLPWLGYFNKIKNSDLFVFLDDVQFERGKTFTSRTKILVNGYENWLTIPVMNRSELLEIKDINVDKNIVWKNKHLRTIELNYKKHPHFKEVYPLLEEVYHQENELLINYNIPLISNICNYLGIQTKLIKSSDIKCVATKNGWEKIFFILIELKAETYLSGSGEGSKRYVNEDDLLKNNIELRWQIYNKLTYKQYNSSTFISNLSIIDLLFNCGKNAVQYF